MKIPVKQIIRIVMFLIGLVMKKKERQRMNEEKTTELIIKISSELASLNTNMRTVLEKLTNHEGRITNLEQNKTGIKDDIVKWLTIALIGTISIIATLTGSAGLIKALVGL